MADILIKNARYLVTMDDERRVIRDGAVAIEKDRITAVGKTGDVVREQGPATRVIDASHHLVMPGLIDAHCHSTQQLARGLADNVFLPTWIHDRLYPYEASLGEEDVYLATMACCLELIRHGTTCFADPGGYHMEQAARAVGEVGIRAVLARSVLDIHASGRPIPEALRESTEAAAREGERFVKEYNGAAEGRIHAWFSLRTERMVSNELCRMVKALAEEYATGIGSHTAAFLDSVNRHKEVFGGKRPIERYHEIGLLGPNLLTYHTNWLTDREVELLKEHDVKVAHCPTASFAGGYGSLAVGKHVEMMQKGVCVALGCDNAAESNFLDMMRVMYTVSGHRDAKQDATLFPPETILEMCLLNGARALLWEKEIGSLQPGMKADIILHHVDRPEWVPIHNPISNLVHSASGDSVETVIIDGKIVMEKGKIKTVDEAAILLRAQRAAEDIARRSGLTRFGLPTWPLS